jgi:hypothetical protein
MKRCAKFLVREGLIKKAEDFFCSTLPELADMFICTWIMYEYGVVHVDYFNCLMLVKLGVTLYCSMGSPSHQHKPGMHMPMPRKCGLPCLMHSAAFSALEMPLGVRTQQVGKWLEIPPYWNKCHFTWSA